MERYNQAARISKLELSAGRQDGELGIVVQAVWSLKGRAAAGKDMANIMEVRAAMSLKKMSKPRALVKGWNQTVGGERVCVAELVDVELVRVELVIIVTLSESGVTLNQAICNLCDSFLVEEPSDAPSPSAEGIPAQA